MLLSTPSWNAIITRALNKNKVVEIIHFKGTERTEQGLYWMTFTNSIKVPVFFVIICDNFYFFHLITKTYQASSHVKANIVSGMNNRIR